MLPTLTQRLLLAGALIVGGACLWPAGRLAGAAEAGPWLLSSEGVWLLLLAIPAAALGLGVSATGHPTAGVFVVAVSLLVPAVMGGPIDARLYRLDSVASYGGMGLEATAYLLLLAGYAWSVRRLRPPLRQRLPMNLRCAHHGDDGAADPWGFAPVPLLLNLAAATLVGGVLSVVLLRSSLSGQVVAGLLLAFGLGGFAARSISPRPSYLGAIAAPLIVALIGYAWVLVRFPDPPSLLAAWFGGELWGLATARPIDYASAGVAGAILGIGGAEALAHARSLQNAPAQA